MADTKVVQAVVPEKVYKRIENQPEKKEFNLSVSKVAALLLKEALDAREAKNDTKKK